MWKIGQMEFGAGEAASRRGKWLMKCCRRRLRKAQNVPKECRQPTGRLELAEPGETLIMDGRTNSGRPAATEENEGSGGGWRHG